MLLPGFEVGEVDGRLDVLDLGDAHHDVGAKPDLSLRLAIVVHHDDRRIVALVDDPVERHIAEPARRLACLDLEPFPIVGIVEVARAVRLRQARARYQSVVQPSQVDRPDDPEPRHLLGEPSTVTVSRGRVLAVRVDLLVQDGKVGEGDPNLSRRGFENLAQRAASVAGHGRSHFARWRRHGRCARSGCDSRTRARPEHH